MHADFFIESSSLTSTRSPSNFMIMNGQDLNFQSFIKHASFQSGQLGHDGGYGSFWKNLMKDRKIIKVKEKKALFLINSSGYQLKIQLLHPFSKELEFSNE